MKNVLALLLVFTLPLLTKAQADISGTWKGTLTLAPGGCFTVYNLELNITLNGNNISGVSYHYSDITNYVKEEFEGTFNPEKHRVNISELKVMTFHVPPDCIPCIKNYSLYHVKEGNKEAMTGEMSGVMMNGNGTCPPGRIVLTRINESAFKEVEKAKQKLQGRANELVQIIKVDTGMIRLNFYDNGMVDDDSISVYVNNFPVASKKRLSAKPVPVDIKIDLTHTEQEVVMLAENLGTIPPNTALMMVTAGNKRYQLFMTSTEKKNAMVRFVYEKPK